MRADICCYWCKSQWGCTNHHCDHHREFEKQDEANAKARRTHKDPTASLAIYRADRARKGKAR